MPRKELTTVVPESGNHGATQVEVTLPLRQRRRESSHNRDLASVSKPISQPSIPRITRLMALAIKFQDMVDRGDVCDYADLARLGYVSRARLTQIMNLCHLAPDIQESLLCGGDGPHTIGPTTERDLREISRIVCWIDQRQVSRQVKLARECACYGANRVTHPTPLNLSR